MWVTSGQIALWVSDFNHDAMHAVHNNSNDLETTVS